MGELLSYEGNVEEDFYLTFQVSTRTEKRPHAALNPSGRRVSTMFASNVKILQDLKAKRRVIQDFIKMFPPRTQT